MRYDGRTQVTNCVNNFESFLQSNLILIMIYMTLNDRATTTTDYQQQNTAQQPTRQESFTISV